MDTSITVIVVGREGRQVDVLGGDRERLVAVTLFQNAREPEHRQKHKRNRYTNPEQPSHDSRLADAWERGKRGALRRDLARRLTSRGSR